MSKKNSRRSFIKKSALVSTCSLIEPAYSLGSNNFMSNSIGHGDFKLALDKGWGIQNPNNYPVNHSQEMVIDSKNSIILTTTHPKNYVLIYDRSG